jgi:hypothetical protein
MSLVRRVPLAGAHAQLNEAGVCAVLAAKHFSPAQCRIWAKGVMNGRDDWNEDWDGEQYSLGRAFYTHLETDRSDEYFAEPEESDAIVEKWTPGLQDAMRELVGRVTGGTVVQRRGWCGPGVHVFPPGQPVSSKGGVCHYDTEGLTAPHIEARRAAITLVAMFQPASSGGGLKVWDVLFDGRDHPNDEELTRSAEVVEYAVGDVVLIDSYRLHQIQSFGGTRERISATVHAAELDRGLWETWF